RHRGARGARLRRVAEPLAREAHARRARRRAARARRRVERAHRAAPPDVAAHDREPSPVDLPEARRRLSRGARVASRAPLTTLVLSRAMSIAHEHVTIDCADDSKMDLYVSRPAEGGRRAGVLVLQEIWGVNAHVRDVADRFARLGYLAVAPDLF